eukprot:m.44665 g.44665  ORF g.44665 m.44665 type:complete len:409 (-) comp19737_c0_seq1:90-1316(-)
MAKDRWSSKQLQSRIGETTPTIKSPTNKTSYIPAAMYTSPSLYNGKSTTKSPSTTPRLAEHDETQTQPRRRSSSNATPLSPTKTPNKPTATRQRSNTGSIPLLRASVLSDSPPKQPRHGGTELSVFSTFPTALLEALAPGDVGYFTTAQMQALQTQGLMSPAMITKASVNGGFLPVVDLKTMAKASGAKSISHMAEQWPIGTKHVTDKKMLKVLKAELAARKQMMTEGLKKGAEVQGGVEAENVHQKQLEKEKQEKEKIAAKLVKEKQKQDALEEKRLKKLKQIEAKEFARATSLKNKKTSKNPKSDPEKDESVMRRMSMEAMLRSGSDLIRALDQQETLERWQSQPLHTRYQAIKKLISNKPGYLDFDVGDLISVSHKADNGYFTGTVVRNGKEGIFPAQYVKFIDK